MAKYTSYRTGIKIRADNVFSTSWQQLQMIETHHMDQNCLLDEKAKFSFNKNQR